MEKRYLYKFFLVCLAACFWACNGYLEEIPQNKQKLTTPDDYEQLLNNAYMAKSVLPYIDILTDDVEYAAEDRDPSKGNWGDTYLGAFMWERSIETTMPSGDPTFELFYNSVYSANVILENIDNAVNPTLDEEALQRICGHIKGEAYALRAYRYLYLVNMYAAPYDPETCETTPGIPINLGTMAEDKPYPRASLKKVYEQIVSDLIAAIPLLEKNPKDAGKTRFSAISAKALLARVYLYMQEWDLAIEQAKDVIQANKTLFDLRNPLFYTEAPFEWSEEALPGNGYLNTDNSNVLFVNGINEICELLGGDNAISLFRPSKDLDNAYDKGDVRRCYFIRHTYSGKLRYVKHRYYDEVYLNFVLQLSSDYGYSRGIRTEEMYLILAEAYAHKTDGIATAVGYLNTLREAKFREEDFETYGRLHSEDFTQQTLLEEIWKERRLELCFEEHRWFDLRRTTRPPMTHKGLKGTSTLQENDLRYVLQIPQKELSVNPQIGANPR